MSNSTQKSICMRLQPIAVGCLLLIACSGGYAAVSCTNFSASNANFAYVASTNNLSVGQSGLNNVVQNDVTFKCRRTVTLTPATIQFGVTNGLYNSGGNRARLAGTPNSFISYNTFKTSACTGVLNDSNASGGADRITVNLTAVLGVEETINVQFFTCITLSQAVTSFPSGIYVDTANMNLRFAGGGAAIDRTNFLNVSINAPALCSISGLPTSNTIPLTYIAFQNTPAFNFASFTANCTNLLPYTMAVSPTSGVVGGLNYQLGLTTGMQGSAGSIGPTSLNDVGGSTGMKAHFINASMQAGQAGQVGAPLSNGHMLTITY